MCFLRKKAPDDAAMRVELMGLLRPYGWMERPTAEENAQAAGTLRQILHRLRETPPREGTISVSGIGHGRLDYLFNLMVVEQKLRRGDLWNACHELENLVYFYPVLRPGIRKNLIDLLAEYLEEWTCGLWRN